MSPRVYKPPIPPIPPTAAEKRAAFRPRPCARCGTRIDPATRTKKWEIAASILYCGRRCNRAAWHARHLPEALQANRENFRRWYAALGPRRKKSLFAAIAAAKKLRDAKPEKARKKSGH